MIVRYVINTLKPGGACRLREVAARVRLSRGQDLLSIISKKTFRIDGPSNAPTDAAGVASSASRSGPGPVRETSRHRPGELIRQFTNIGFTIRTNIHFFAMSPSRSRTGMRRCLAGRTNGPVVRRA
jgi:hypothetical protein